MDRTKGLGGTDSPVVMGVSPWTTKMDLWMEKRGLLEPEPETPAMRRGKALEPLIADIYQQKTGRRLLNITDKDEPWTHPEFPFITAHPDFEISTIGTPDPPGILEIKCLGLRSFSKVKREGIPLPYLIQLQHYLSFPEYSWGAFAIFNAELWDLVHFDVQRDTEMIKNIIEMDRDFWTLVENGTPPPDEGLSFDRFDLPKSEGQIIKNDSQEWAEAMASLREAREIRADAEALEDEAKAAVQMLMGENQAVEGAGARVYSTMQNGRKTLDRKKMEKASIDLTPYEKIGKPFKVFKPFWIKGGLDGE